MSAPALEALADILRAGGGLLSDAVVAPDASATAEHGDLAAAGPRVVGHERDYALLVEAIREGYLQHYGVGRVLRPDDPDLALLGGDRLYALGLALLAELGDLEAVGVLADVISRSAQVHAEGRPDDADAVWSDGVTAVTHGRPAPG